MLISECCKSLYSCLCCCFFSNKETPLDKTKTKLSWCINELKLQLSALGEEKNANESNHLAKLKTALIELDKVAKIVDQIEAETQDSAKAANDPALGDKRQFTSYFRNFCDHTLFNPHNTSYCALQKLIQRKLIQSSDSVLCKQYIIEQNQASQTVKVEITSLQKS